MDDVTCEIKFEYGDLRDWFYVDGIDPNSDSKVIDFTIGLMFDDKTVERISDSKVHRDVDRIKISTNVGFTDKLITSYVIQFANKDQQVVDIKSNIPLIGGPLTINYTISQNQYFRGFIGE